MGAPPRLILVGEAPGRDSIADRPRLALTGSSGKNLCRIMGWDWAQYLRRTERHNLFYDPQPKWRDFDAFVAAMMLIPEVCGRRVPLILLGRRVARAFSLDDLEEYDWQVVEGDTFMMLPHPSGRNRVWNDPAQRERARALIGGLL